MLSPIFLPTLTGKEYRQPGYLKGPDDLKQCQSCKKHTRLALLQIIILTIYVTWLTVLNTVTECLVLFWLHSYLNELVTNKYCFKDVNASVLLSSTQSIIHNKSLLFLSDKASPLHNHISLMVVLVDLLVITTLTHACSRHKQTEARFSQSNISLNIKKYKYVFVPSTGVKMNEFHWLFFIY